MVVFGDDVRFSTNEESMTWPALVCVIVFSLAFFFFFFFGRG
jgi:hypothetical protein